MTDTQRQCLVAVVASAGGVEAFGRLLAALPPDLKATVLVQLHVAAGSRSLLPQVLARHSALPVLTAVQGMPLCAGQVIVSVPDHHLLVEAGAVVLGTGPPEGGHRPSHDLLLESVATHSGARATGVVLSGLLHDGARGLRCVADHGGVCVVQDPADAEFADMPRNALREVPHARTCTLDDLPHLIASAVRDCTLASG